MLPPRSTDAYVIRIDTLLGYINSLVVQQTIEDEDHALGLYVGFLPTWGDKWNKKWGKGPEIFTPENAAAYREWLAANPLR